MKTKLTNKINNNLKTFFSIMLFVFAIGVSGVFAQTATTTSSTTTFDPLKTVNEVLDNAKTTTTATGTGQGGAGGDVGQGGAGAGLPKTKSGLQITLTNPLKVDNLEDFVNLVLSVILKFLIPILAVLFMWTGFKLVMARGNEKALGEAKKDFFNLVIGAVLILGAWTFGTIIMNTLREVGILD